MASFDGLRFRHWQVEPRADGVLLLSFDRAESTVNTFSQDVLLELGSILERIAMEPPKGLVVRSAKAAFAAGADLKSLQELDRRGQVGDFIHLGQQVFQKIAELPCPTVAAIHCFCMGGGTEISLACRYRVAASDALRAIAEAGAGVMVVLSSPRNSEALLARVRAQPEAPQGKDVGQWRRNGAGAQILADLGLGKLRVLGTPRRQVGLSGFGLDVVEYVQ